MELEKSKNMIAFNAIKAQYNGMTQATQTSSTLFILGKGFFKELEARGPVFANSLIAALKQMGGSSQTRLLLQVANARDLTDVEKNRFLQYTKVDGVVSFSACEALKEGAMEFFCKGGYKVAAIEKGSDCTALIDASFCLGTFSRSAAAEIIVDGNMAAALQEETPDKLLREIQKMFTMKTLAADPAANELN